MSDLLKKINVISGKLSVKKDGKNPYFKSKYITLDEIMDKLQPLLDEQWLMVYNYNLRDWGVRTIVTDFEDSVSSDFVIEGISDPQGLAKVLTYWRRYNLVSIFNILADEDDDAQSFYDEKGEVKKKYDKKIFGMRELENLSRKKDKYSFEDALKMLEENYSVSENMLNKVGDLYGKMFDGEKRVEINAENLF